MKLTKIYSEDCDVCAALGRVAEPQAIDRGWSYEELALSDVATNPSPIRDYVSAHHLDEEGMVSIPIYIFSEDSGEVLSSGVVSDEAELAGVFFTFDIVDNSRG